ncbi:MAG TPA: 1-acyl-sn-glycerol-3-phosphate acyltransferase [Myxococcaceae bacterium]|nr:1-acyl-sn-glycerol-3-phosphate acyltransferase [Myxococcaceae bacterium]
MPPAIIRRPLTITAWLLLSTFSLVLSPVLLALGTLASRLTGRPQPKWLARLLIAYCTRELGGILAAGGLWLASGCGAGMQWPRIQEAHYRLLGWYVRGLAERVLTLLDLDVRSELTPEVAEVLAADRPLIFLSRHAGPGDTLLLIDQLLSRYDRYPSVVFKQTLTIDPCLDLIGHRLPHAVLDTSEAAESEARIEEITSELGPRGVLVIFPEGGNFTPERRRRALRHLRRKGHRREARAGEQMTHMMPPHPSGALAAFRGNPAADVLFSAHTGLGLAAFPGQLWRQTPVSQTLRTHLWLAPSSDRPEHPDEQVRWLYDWWRRLDEWVEEKGEPVGRPELPEPPTGGSRARAS